ncbi:SDR family NAD(P)-dependent oxidoreductase [Zavarzinia sp. CC-PAN008]|uniref:SDR family NAD(P)-dependent oxidoreductase n=1 Tax=Zavarzinia sp. CC-PAN008 TaxID=3243332 RepID=UPI003F74852A
MIGRLAGKVAVITGGAAGIGRATTELFLKEGACVVVGDLQAEEGERMAGSLGAGFAFRRTDVAVEADVKALIDLAVERFGRIDVLFNNAGYGGTVGGVAEIDMDKFDVSVAVLLKGVFAGYKHAVPHMRRQGGGSIISTASVAGITGGGGPLVYSVCKAGVIHLAKCAALELLPDNIRSNAICPGGIATQLLARGFGVGKATAEDFGQYMRKLAAEGRPLHKVGVPEDIAEMALFLASDASKFVTGQAIAVDGGYTAGASLNAEMSGGARAALQEFSGQRGG